MIRNVSRWLTSAPLIAAMVLACGIAAFTVHPQPVSAANASIGASGSTRDTARFKDNIATVSAGDTVTFAWASGRHTATAAAGTGVFNIPLTSQSFVGTWTPSAPGTYYFFCAVHSSADLATEAHVVANDTQVGKIVVLPGPAAAPAPGQATPPPSDFTQFGFPVVGGSTRLAAGAGGTVTAGGQSVTIDPGTFTTDVTFDLLTGNAPAFAALATDRVIASFAFRVAGPGGAAATFARPVHYTLTSADVSAGSQVFNTRAVTPITATRNTTPAVISGQTLKHDFSSAGAGWFVTTTAAQGAPGPAKTGTGGLVERTDHTGAVILFATLAVLVVAGGRLLTRNRDR